jgi:hypothetical protein
MSCESQNAEMIPMKYTRVFMALAVLGAAACSSPTEPRLPTPDPDDKEPKDPDKPGATATLDPWTIDGLTFATHV